MSVRISTACLAAWLVATALGMRSAEAQPAPVAPAAKPAAAECVLFDFEDPADLARWTPTNLAQLREEATRAMFEELARKAADPSKATRYVPRVCPPEPPVKLERSTEGVTRGAHSLKLTYAGGTLPTVGTDAVADDWTPYQTFRANVTTSRECVVIFRVMREKSKRGDDWDGAVSRYEKVARLSPGRNEVVELTNARGFAPLGKVVRFEITMFEPKEGESITVDNVRLEAARPAAGSPYSYMNVHYMGEVRPEAPFFPKLDRKIKVLGTDWEMTQATDLGEKVKDTWVKPGKKTVDEVEAEFKAAFEKLKAAHPRAVMAIFRDGEKGYDPANPDRTYDGWRDTQLQGHDPGSVYASVITSHPGRGLTSEMFLRRRCFLMKADLSSIPKGSEVLLARFMAVKTESPREETLKSDYAWESPLKPAFFVAEACNRDWDEDVANGIEYAKGKFWKEICGEYWSGDDPDFLPIVIAWGQAGHDQNVFDFTNAVKFWTEGTHPNYGFTMYSFGNYMEYCSVFMRHVADVKKRPALMVVYEPKL